MAILRMTDLDLTGKRVSFTAAARGWRRRGRGCG